MHVRFIRPDIIEAPSKDILRFIFGGDNPDSFPNNTNWPGVQYDMVFRVQKNREALAAGKANYSRHLHCICSFMELVSH